MNIPGLYQLAAHKRQQAEWCRATAKRSETDPRTAHENEQAAEQLVKEADDLEAHAKGNEDLILGIETLIHYFPSSPHQSAHRALAMRHLEDASMRLQRENGTTTLI
jgi:hypothetical protein